MPRYAAFLRGVMPMNAKMPELRGAFEAAGFKDVKTVLASGNVVFTAAMAAEASLEQKAEAAMQRQLGREFLTIVRPVDALRETLTKDPYQDFRLPSEAKRIITFLRGRPRARLELPIEFDGARILAMKGGEVFSAYVRSPKGPVFMSLIEKTFGKEQTTRTWDTLTKVVKAAAGCLLAILTASPSPAQAQAARQLRLGPANAELNEEFTSIGSVRVLSDGRVLITDPREGRVVLADLKTGAVQQVGRKGQGPNEYGNAGPLIALAADSSLMVDFTTRRWLLFSGPSIAATLPPDTPIIKAIKTFVRGADGRGYVWIPVSPREFVQETAKPGTLTFGPADSDFVVRGNRATGRLDTVTKLRVAVSRRTVTANAEGKFQSVIWSPAPLAAGEEAALFADGWFAVARLDPYRVDWISPEGRVSRGRPIPVTPIKVTTAEQEAYFARRAAARGSGRAIPAQVEALREREMVALRDQFPAVFPPFTAGAIAGADGNLWLRHPVSKDFPNYRYDVVDRSGQLIGVVSLAKGERIVSVGKTAVYVAWKDEDDIERLRRHPLPYEPTELP